MAKFILHGGYIVKNPEKQSDLYRQIADDTPENGCILVCCFARDMDVWQDKFDNFSNVLKEFVKASVRFKLASLENFVTEFEDANTVAFLGGKTDLMNKRVSEIGGFIKAVKKSNDKLIIGSSAGANLLAKIGVDNEGTPVVEGLGLLPVSVVVHSNVPEFKEFSSLIGTHPKGGECPVIHIPEYEFVTMEYNG